MLNPAEKNCFVTFKDICKGYVESLMMTNFCNENILEMPLTSILLYF